MLVYLSKFDLQPEALYRCNRRGARVLRTRNELIRLVDICYHPMAETALVQMAAHYGHQVVLTSPGFFDHNITEWLWGMSKAHFWAENPCATTPQELEQAPVVMRRILAVLMILTPLLHICEPADAPVIITD